ncbi:hypothetical protein TBLA_0J00630 [Henningerozyma blattae CBS 6284]|uniref:Uncharacterized protein n=1 Tax=Henningerozyma blattae (strain ATCC 34711 / CBS 6284 / DSM 70876 / NBRC 10599 / NRRL Y-10934 / UCD 77-7) TaxID=1071380 RepID=I2H9L1_HENB6|nr:hypothetical protein TBLA_0J00630 [Tetrapisispora blattae CBS 6284]CCH63063.1 hypothetical protein TBLA_0J00630 [Tetrapisispora blattae CBS 6284]
MSSINFIVSTPNNKKNTLSGHRIFEFDKETNRLSVIPYYQSSTNSDKNISIQSILTLHSNDPEFKNNDILIIAKSNGFIEIICDINYKIQNKLDLRPDFLLKCIPEDFNASFANEFLINDLNYNNGLLYCCTCSGRLYIFILNLHSSYLPTQDFSPSDVSIMQFTQEETLFQNIISYTRDRPMTHFLLPCMDNSHLTHSPFLSLSLQENNDIYPPDLPTYRTSIYSFIGNGNIISFKLNPLKFLSFIITTIPKNSFATSTVSIRKIQLPLRFIHFIQSYNSIKHHLQTFSKTTRPINFNKLAKLIGYNSVYDWFLSNDLDSITNQNRIKINSITWDEIAKRDGTAILSTFLVWKQKKKSNNNNNRSSFLSNSANFLNRSNSIHPQQLTNDNIRYLFNKELSPTYNNHSDELDLTNLTTVNQNDYSSLNKNNSYTIDFLPIITSITTTTSIEPLFIPSSHNIDPISNSTIENKLGILLVDKYNSISLYDSLLSSFNISSLEMSTTTLNLCNNIFRNDRNTFDYNNMNGLYSKFNNNSKQMIRFLNDENNHLKMNLNLVNSFYKIYAVPIKNHELEYLFLTSYGVLFLKNNTTNNNINDSIVNHADMGISDSSSHIGLFFKEINDHFDIDKLSTNSIKFAPSLMDIINDSILIIDEDDNLINEKSSNTNDNNNVYLKFILIVTCLPSQIKAYRGTFYKDSKIGELSLCDSLKLTTKDRTLTKMSILSK